MYGLVDPTTNETLPSDAIQRVLFICHPVHVYAIPPLRSTKGYRAADWTANESSASKSPETPASASASINNGAKEIFIARLRVLETAIPVPAQQASPRIDKCLNPASSSADLRESEKVKADIVLEDPSTGALFAAAPYTSASVAEQTIDSSRFFALRVVGDGGRKAVLGIGFEDRSQSFDFGVTLQDVRKVLGFAKSAAEMNTAGTIASSGGSGGSTASNHALPAMSSTMQRSGTPRPIITGAAGLTGREIPGRGTPSCNACPGGVSPLRQAAGGRLRGFPSASVKPSSPAPKDYSLRPGQKINVNIPGRNSSPLPVTKSASSRFSPLATPEQEKKALFSLAPPPSPAGCSRSVHSGTALLSPNNSSSTGNAESAFSLPPPPSGTINRRRRPPDPIFPEVNEKKPHEVAFPTPPSSTGWTTENELHNDFDDSDFGDFQ